MPDASEQLPMELLEGKIMNDSNHHEGFETEFALINIFKNQAEVAQWKDFKECHSDLFANAFQRKPCIRLLRYIGRYTSSPDGGFFAEDSLHRSTHFNGATYTIQGSDRLIGYNHLELIIDMTRGNL